jgi:hypothetical protein
VVLIVWFSRVMARGNTTSSYHRFKSTDYLHLQCGTEAIWEIVVDIYNWGGKTDHGVEKWSITYENGPGGGQVQMVLQ